MEPSLSPSPSLDLLDDPLQPEAFLEPSSSGLNLSPARDSPSRYPAALSEACRGHTASGGSACAELSQLAPYSCEPARTEHVSWAHSPASGQPEHSCCPAAPHAWPVSLPWQRASCHARASLPGTLQVSQA